MVQASLCENVRPQLDQFIDEVIAPSVAAHAGTIGTPRRAYLGGNPSGRPLGGATLLLRPLV